MNKQFVLSYTDKKRYLKLHEYAKILMHMKSDNPLIKKMIIEKLIKIDHELKSIKLKYRTNDYMIIPCN